MSKNQINSGSKSTKGFDELLTITGYLFGITFRGMKAFFGTYPLAYFIAFVWIWFSGVIAFWDFKHLWLANKLFPNLFNPTVIELFVDYVPYAKIAHTLFLSFSPWSILGFVYGFLIEDPMKNATAAIKHLGLKTADDKEPKVVKVIQLDEYRKKILISSVGVGVDRYIAKKSDLEMSLRSTIENIGTTANNKFIEILTTDRIIPTMLPYRNCLSGLIDSMQFPLGDSRGGLLVQDLSILPHMMIAGASGGGKSNFFKQTILSLLKTTPRIQVYLLDLKKGIEAKEFGNLPNVTIAKTESEASILLAKLRNEMNSRFEILERTGRTSIDPERDQKDVIVVAVDEASVLYSKTRVSKQKKQSAAEARELTDDLAKLGRAAKIHLILATQKVTTETIDTKIQENMGGRICFKANTLQGSMTVLGNKMAYDLPDIKGRAVWANGTTFVEVQTPFIKDEVLVSEIKSIKSDFDNGMRKNFDVPYNVDLESRADKNKTEQN